MGLGRHAEWCDCRAGDRLRIDFHDPDEDGDWITVCPLTLEDPSLTSRVYKALEIESYGGLDRYTGRPVGHLPTRLVHFYAEVLAARDRLLAERDAVRSDLYAEG